MTLRCTHRANALVFVFLFVGTNQSIIQLTFVYLDCSRLRLQDDRAASSAIPLLPYPTPPEKTLVNVSFTFLQILWYFFVFAVKIYFNIYMLHICLYILIFIIFLYVNMRVNFNFFFYV